MNIQTAGVVGGGTAGRGIARALAQAGVDVVLCEAGPEMLEKSLAQLREGMNRDIARWAMTDTERDAVLARVKGSISLEELSEVPVVFEAIQEDRERKATLLDRLDRICREDTVFFTNTSTLSVTELGEKLPARRRPRFAGLHFLHPVPRVSAVELVQGRETSKETLGVAREVGALLEKEVVEVSEYPGYVTTRLTLALVNEAMNTLLEGVATRDGIDRSMKLRLGGSHGPLALADEMGLDSVHRALESLWSELGLPQFRPSPVLRMMVSRGWLGEKSGRGFYQYDESGQRVEDETLDLGRPELEELIRG
ncbi:MAG: 3-hydroxyacyl-CoA dehydrogenase NAD-binding domain-containing protein [Gemmatimonadota bacterium]|jgi:3-hydroxybutyryl-CoA dehydrogenase